jgi:hypothetical protein
MKLFLYKQIIFAFLCTISLGWLQGSWVHAQPPPVDRWKQVACHLGHLCNQSGQFGFGSAVSTKESFGIGPVDLGYTTTERFYGDKSTGTSNNVNIKAYIVEGKWKIEGGREISVGLTPDAVDLAFKAAETAALPLGPGAVALVAAIRQKMPKSVKDAIKLQGEFGIDIGNVSKTGTLFVRIYTGGSIKVGGGFKPSIGGLKKAGGSAKVVRTWQISQKTHLQQLGIPTYLIPDGVLRVTTDLGEEDSDFVVGSGDPNQPFYYESDASAGDQIPFTKDIQFSTLSGIPYTFRTQAFNFWMLPQRPLTAADFGIAQLGLTLGNYQFKGPSFSDFLSPSGVDFSGLTVAGIDVDNAQNTVNFIFKADNKIDSPGSNYQNETSLLKKVFLQALTIPNQAQWVSLDREDEGTGTIGRANADQVFKQTDMCQLFFAADAQMKTELYQELAQLGQVKGVYNLWLSYFRDVNPEMYNRLTAKGLTFPNVFMRGLIVPKTPSGNKDNRIFIENATYQLKHFIDAIQYGAFVNQSLPTDEALYFVDRSIEFETALRQKLADAARKVETRINQGAHPHYAALKRILPAIVAAHWYKAQNLNNAQALFYSLIDRKDLGTQYTGNSLVSATPFDQAYWDNQANQILGYETFTIDNISYRVQIRGGVENQDTKVNQLGASLSITQKNIVSAVSKNAYSQQEGKNYVYGGLPTFNLPEFSIGYLYESTDENMAEGVAGDVMVSIINSGNVDATNVAVALYEMTLNDAGQVTSTRFVQGQTSNLPKLSQKDLPFRYTPSTVGNVKLVAYINTNTANYAVSPQPELVNYNNLWEHQLLIRPRSPRSLIYPVNPEYQYVKLLGDGYDPQGLPLTFEWTSSRQGLLGSQKDLALPVMQAGTHQITLKVSNSLGQFHTSTVTVNVADCPTEVRSFKEPLIEGTGAVEVGTAILESEIRPGITLEIRAKNAVLKPGFHAQAGSSFLAMASYGCQQVSAVSPSNSTTGRLTAISPTQSPEISLTNRAKTRLTIEQYPAIVSRPERQSTDLLAYKEQLFSPEPLQQDLAVTVEPSSLIAREAQHYQPHPVPFSEQLLIPSHAGERIIATLYDGNGKQLMQKHFDVPSKAESGMHSLDTTQLPNGVYFLRIETAEGKHFSYQVKKVR